MFATALTLLLVGLVGAELGMPHVALMAMRVGLFVLAIKLSSLAFPVIFGLLDHRRSIV